MSCKHEWVVLVDKLVPSLAERISTIFRSSPEPFTINVDNKALGKSITIMACKKCGAIDKTIEDV